MGSNSVRSTFYNFVTIGLNAASGLFVTALIARWLAPSGMGAYSLITWFYVMAVIVVNLGHVTTTMKFMAESLGQGDLPGAGGILAHGLRRMLKNGVVVTGVWYALTPTCAALYQVPALVGAMCAAGLAIVPTAVMGLLIAACQGIQAYERVAKATALYAIVLVAGSALVLGQDLGIPGLFGVLAGASTATCAMLLRHLWSWLPGWHRLAVTPARRQALGGYGASLMVLILLDAIVWQRSGVFFLGLWHPAAEVAFYSLAFGLATMAMKLIPGTLVGLLIPRMARSSGSGDLQQIGATYRTAGRWMAILACPVAIGGMVLAPALVTALYGPPYAPLVPILRVLLLGGTLVMIFGFPASSVLYAIDGQRHLVRVGLAVAGCNLLLAVIAIPIYGAFGAALVTSLSQIASLIPGAYYVAASLGGIWPDCRRLPAVGAAAVAMGLPVAAIAAHLSPVAALALAIPIGAFTYCGGLWLFRALTDEDLARVRSAAVRLPLIRKLVAVRA